MKVKIHLLVKSADGPLVGSDQLLVDQSSGELASGDKNVRFHVACRPLHPKLPTYATGEWRGTTCPDCMATEAYLTAKALDERHLSGELE